MGAHSHHFRNDGLAGPLDAEDLGQLLEVAGRGISDREDRVTQPPHAQRTQFLIEELHPELAGKKRDVLNYGQSHSPLLVFGELDDGRE